MAAALVSVCGVAAAQPKTDESLRIAQSASNLYQETCFKLLPDIDALSRLAGQRAWKPIAGHALRALAPAEAPELIMAWNAPIDGQTFPLVATRSPVDPDVARDMPRFAGGKSYNCSVLITAKSQPQHDSELMVRLMGRMPDATNDAGRQRWKIWAGETESTLVFIQHMQVLTAGKIGPGGLLGVTVTLKKQP